MDLLFKPRNGETPTEKKDVPLLKTGSTQYKQALNELISDWIDGKIGEGPPTEEWDKELVKKVNDYENKVGTQADSANKVEPIGAFKNKADGPEVSANKVEPIGAFKNKADGPDVSANKVEPIGAFKNKAYRPDVSANKADSPDVSANKEEMMAVFKTKLHTKDEIKADIENNVEHTEELKDVHTALTSWNVQNHLKTVNSHRKWLRLTQELLEKCGIVFSEKITELVRKHDLSKYTHWEALGYSVMFGDCQTAWKKLEDEDEKNAWQESLDHHYAVNPHHPEFFFPKLGDGKRDNSKGMLDSDKENGEDYLIESLIDMLAAGGERGMKGDAVFSVSKWMDIDGRYMGRYNDKDRIYVSELLEKWKLEAGKLDLAKMESVQGHFDGRPTVN